MKLNEYRDYWQKQAYEEKIFLQKLRKRAVRTAFELRDELVKHFHVRKVILFGSVLREGDFREDSDIDLAVEGLSKRMYFAAVARLMMKSRFDIDLKPLEEVSELLKKRISQGKVLYEKRADS